MPQRIAVSRNRHETLIATHRLSIACTGDFASFDNPGRAGEFRCLGQRVVSILCCPLLQGNGVHNKTCSTSPVVAARCDTDSALCILDIRVLGTQKSSPEMKEYMANDASEYVAQRIGCSISQLRRRCSPPSPTPILIPEEPEHSAGIGPSPEEPGGTR